MTERRLIAGVVQGPTPDAQEQVRTWSTAAGSCVTYRRTFGVQVYWAVDWYPIGWPKLTPAAIEMARADLHTQAEAEARAETIFAELAWKRA